MDRTDRSIHSNTPQSTRHASGRPARPSIGSLACRSRITLLAALLALPLLVGTPGTVGAQVSEERVARLEAQLTALQERLRQEQADRERIAELERRIEVLARELQQARVTGGAPAVRTGYAPGLGPAASTVYSAGGGVSVAGYGEMLYEDPAARDESGAPTGLARELDFYRAIVYVGNRFSDRILFNSELEFEHGGEEVAVEFAYLDFLLGSSTGVRAGMLLIPMGFLNELHEPPVFLGTQRPLTETYLIPSTWSESGVGLYGSFAGLHWRAYLLNGLDASGFTAGGLRGGRQGGAEALANDFGLTFRVDWEGLPGVRAGVSGWLGDSGQGALDGAGERIEARTSVFDLHAEYNASGLRLRALAAQARVGDAAALNTAAGFTGGESIGSLLAGWYAEAGYDLFAGRGGSSALVPYLRYERLDTQQEVPAGFTADPANDRTATTLGVAWRPIPDVVWKADYTWMHTAAKTGVDRFHVQLGYLF